MPEGVEAERGLLMRTAVLPFDQLVVAESDGYRGKRKRLKSKDGKRDIPLPASIAEKLLAHRRDTYVSPKAPVFVTTTGSELDPHNVCGQSCAVPLVGECCEEALLLITVTAREPDASDGVGVGDTVFDGRGVHGRQRGAQRSRSRL
jgi:hypothetical protein